MQPEKGSKLNKEADGEMMGEITMNVESENQRALTCWDENCEQAISDGFQH